MKKDPNKDRQRKAPGSAKDPVQKPDTGAENKKKDQPESRQEPVSRF